MENNLNFTTNDFENICRTCLSRQGLKPLHEKYLLEMLMTCTVVQFAGNDGLPAKICTNCINQINKSFSFAKLCEATDKILRKCLIKLETEVTMNLSYSQKVEPTIKTEEEISPAIIDRTEEVLGEYECIEDVKLEEDVKMEFEENMMEVQAEMKIKIENNETYDDLGDKSNEMDDDDELRDETSIVHDHESYQDERCSEEPDKSGSRFNHTPTNFQTNDDEGFKKSNNSGSRPRRRCTVSQIQEKSSEDNDSENYDDPGDKSYEEEDDTEDQDETYSEKHDNSGSRLKRKTFCHQTNEASTKNKIGQHKHDRSAKSSKQINERQKGLHTGKKPHICEVCSKGFSLNTDLKRHMRIHTGEKPFACKDCNKGFTQSGYLKLHMRVHTGEKPCVCKVCNKGFTQSGYLKEHMRVHTGQKPFACKVCNKGFTQSGCVKLHMRVHTGEKPFVCMVCNKGFTQSGNLKKHMRIHTGEKPHTCEVCSKSFSQSTSLNRHIKNAHRRLDFSDETRRRIHTGKEKNR